MSQVLRPACPPDEAGIKDAIERLLIASGAALDEETRKTPERVARALIDDLLDGYRRDPVALLKGSLALAPRAGELVVAARLDFHAMCPHHLLPYQGVAAVAYITEQHLVGFGRIADALAAVSHRLIFQEQLADQLCRAVMAALAPRGVGVVLSADHGCLRVRGPVERRSRITVEAWLGALEHDAALQARVIERAREA